MPWFFVDYWYIVLVLPAVFLTLVAQIHVKSVFSRYSRVPCALTGTAASRLIQQNNGLSLPIVAVNGSMTDFYDPVHRSIHLSNTVRDMATVSAVGVAAHETGHALQYAQNYGPAVLRTRIVPITNFASGISIYLVLFGLLLSFEFLAYVGVFCFGFAVLFQLITLPVEFDASNRAIRMLTEGGYITESERSGVKAVLNAAALTYVAAAVTSIMSLLRLLLIARSRDRD